MVDRKLVIYRVPHSFGGFQVAVVLHNSTKCVFAGSREVCKRFIEGVTKLKGIEYDATFT